MTDVTTIPPLTHDEAMRLQAVELERAVAMLASLDAEAWAAQTDCPDWDVRSMYLHVLGACEAGASTVEGVRQLAKALRQRRTSGGPLEAALSSVQVRDRSDLTTNDIVSRLRAVAPKTVRGRRRLPAVLRSKVRIPIDGPVVEKWSLGYLVGTIYLRDLWMHRVDASRATGATLDLTADHDGRIVADIVAEWARRHGRSFVLELSGPAGGTFTATAGTTNGGAAAEERLALDAVEFCRTLAGRRTADGDLLATVVPF